jgi:bisphosphoglycerate-dependent phosphoglycerate mutase
MNGAELNKRLYMNAKNSPEIEKAKKYGDEAIRLWQQHKDLELEIRKLSSPNQ